MNRRSMEKLKLDRRLIRRTGWISRADLDRALEELPDVATKIADKDREEASPPPEPGSAE